MTSAATVVAAADVGAGLYQSEHAWHQRQTDQRSRDDEPDCQAD